MDDVLKFNAIDGKTDRRSHHGPYQLDEDGAPMWVPKSLLVTSAGYISYSFAKHKQLLDDPAELLLS